MQNKKGSLWEFLQSYLKSLKKLRSCFMKHLVLRLESFANWGKISFLDQLPQLETPVKGMWQG